MASYQVKLVAIHRTNLALITMQSLKPLQNIIIRTFGNEEKIDANISRADSRPVSCSYLGRNKTT